MLGQDPYHGPNQANDEIFQLIQKSLSLLNIFKEYSTDFNLPIPADGICQFGQRGVRY